MYEFQNSVNARLGKPHFSWQEYEETYLTERLRANHV